MDHSAAEHTLTIADPRRQSSIASAGSRSASDPVASRPRAPPSAPQLGEGERCAAVPAGRPGLAGAPGAAIRKSRRPERCGGYGGRCGRQAFRRPSCHGRRRAGGRSSGPSQGGISAQRCMERRPPGRPDPRDRYLLVRYHVAAASAGITGLLGQQMPAGASTGLDSSGILQRTLAPPSPGQAMGLQPARGERRAPSIS